MINGPAPSERAATVGLSAARARVLEYLEAQPEAVTAARTAADLDLHGNTARLHLEGLVGAGLATRTKQAAGGRGRPAMLYNADIWSQTDPRVRDYAQLASALATVIAETSPDPTMTARAAGAGWGASLAQGRKPTTPRKARREVIAILGELGFDPAPDSAGTSVALRRCPLLDVARKHTSVVCQVHLGLVQGAMHEMGHDSPGADLIPFAEPGACRLFLTEAAGRRQAD
ncbi:MAG TPA: transcriptional regulator [Actinomycetota bacterium]|nr:transcriptional regulator [Actinomycetota bacterium]